MNTSSSGHENNVYRNIKSLLKVGPSFRPCDYKIARWGRQGRLQLTDHGLTSSVFIIRKSLAAVRFPQAHVNKLAAMALHVVDPPNDSYQSNDYLDGNQVYYYFAGSRAYQSQRACLPRLAAMWTDEKLDEWRSGIITGDAGSSRLSKIYHVCTLQHDD